MSTPTELFIAAELPKRPYTNTFPFAAGKTLITTGVGLEVVAGDAPGEYLDNTFRIKDNDNTTKKIAFQASGIATGETRTITMPDADVNLSKTPTGVAADYISGGLSMPLVDGTYVNLNTFGGTHLDGPNSPATVLSPNGHYLFSTDTAFYYAGTRLLTLPTAPADKTYVRLSNVSGISSFATGAGAEVTPGGSDKINGSASTLDITTYLVNYRGAVITFTYTASSANWNMSVLGDLIRPSSVAIYDADKTNSTTLTPVADLTDNRVITLPDADVNLGKVSQAASTSTDGYLTSTDWDTFNGKQATLVSGTNIKTVNGSSLLGSGNLTITMPTTFSDIAFRIQDNNNATKQIAFEASGITAGQTRTVTMPDSPVNLGQMMNTVTVLGTYAIPTQESSVNPAQRYHLVMYGSYSIDFNNMRGWVQVTNVTAASITVTITAGVASFINDAGTAITNFTLVAGETAYLTQAGTIITLRRYASASSDNVRVYDQTDVTKRMRWNVSGIATGQTKTITMPNADVNLGTMSSVATTDSNTLGGTRCRIVGGNNNNVSGTDNIVIGGSNNSLEGANNVSISSVNVGITYNAVYPSQKGIGNTFIGCVNYVAVFNVASVNSTYINYTFSSNAYFKNSLQPTSYSIVIGDSSGGGGCVVHSTLMSTNSLPLVSGSSNSSYPEIPACRVVGSHTITLHRVKLICTDGFTASVYGAVMEREVLVNSNSTILSITTIGTDTTWGGITITPAFTIVNDALRIICTKSGGASCFNRAYITSYY